MQRAALKKSLQLGVRESFGSKKMQTQSLLPAEMGRPAEGRECRCYHSNFHLFCMVQCGEGQNTWEIWNKILLLQVKAAQLLACSDSLYSTQISKCFCIELELSLKTYVCLQTFIFHSWSLSVHSVLMFDCFHVLFLHWPIGIFFQQPLKRKKIKMEPCRDTHSNPSPRQGSLCVA